MNIETWTLGGIAALTTAIILLITNMRKLSNEYQSSVQKIVKAEIKPVSDKIDSMSRKLDSVDMETTKNFLVTVIGEIDRAGFVDESTRARFYEQYDHYEKMGGNTYIHTRFEELKKQGKL